MSVKGQIGWAKMNDKLNLPKLNPNRGPDKTSGTSKRKLKDEVQRLTTYNTLLWITLNELYDHQSQAQRTGQSAGELESYKQCMERCEKVLS